MAKTAKVKKRQVTVHSRAARRANSPTLPLTKATSKPPTRSSISPSRPSQANPHALAAKNAGIQKKQKKGTITRAQRLRHQKGLERAADNMDKLELKRTKSVGREKHIKERAKGWEDVNSGGVKKGKKDRNVFEDLGDKAEREWVSDEEMDEEEGVGEVSGEGDVKGEGKQGDVVVPESVPLPIEEDELL